MVLPFRFLSASSGLQAQVQKSPPGLLNLSLLLSGETTQK